MLVGPYSCDTNSLKSHNTGCAEKDKCQCDLAFQLDEQQRFEVEVGAQEFQDIPFQVSNQGDEPAYGVTIVFSSTVHFPKIEGPRGKCQNEGKYQKICSAPKVPKDSEIRPSFKFFFPSDFEGQDKFNISAELKHSCVGNENSTRLDIEPHFELKFESKIELTTSVSSSEVQYQLGSETFNHYIKLENQGPSYTTEAKMIQLYLPNSNLTSVNVTPESNIICQRNEEGAIELEMEIPLPNEGTPIGCTNTDCIVFTCTIPTPWMKNEVKEFNIEFEFNSTVAETFVNSTFSVYSLALIDDQKVVTRTKLTEVQLGATEKMVVIWPIFLGGGIGIAIIIVTMIILWKTGVLAKCRPYKLDEEQLQKSQMRLSDLCLNDLLENSNKND